MALSRTTSRLFNKAPTYTRPSQNPAVGAASGYGAGPSQAVPPMPISPNPMMQQQLPMIGQSQRRYNAITESPFPSGSLQASGISQSNPMSSAISGISNHYGASPNSVQQGRAYGLTLPMDLAGQQNRIANQNPMYQGMQSRFGPGSGVGLQAAMIAQNEGAGNIRIPGSYGEMPTYVQKGPSPEVKYDMLGRSSVVNTDPVLRDQFTALKGFTPNAERGANRKAAREATKSRLADSRFKMQVSKGLNPNSAKAKAMFPAQVAKMQGTSPGNPMAAPPGSIESQMQGAGKVAEDLVSNPHLVAIGATPDSKLADINSGFSSHMANGGTFTDESLKAYQEHAKAQEKTRTKENDPFGWSSVEDTTGLEGQMWLDLAHLPDTPEARKDWLSRYKSAKRTQRSATSPNPGYAAPGVPYSPPPAPGYNVPK